MPRLNQILLQLHQIKQQTAKLQLQKHAQMQKLLSQNKPIMLQPTNHGSPLLNKTI
jgi:hypothetical protein